MAVKVIIPTPLRPYAGKKESVELQVYVNDEDIRYLRGDQTPLREGDILSIVPSIAGGTRN
jgi:molybdopterin converting factor small subunit